MGAVAGAEPGEGGLRVGADGLGAEAEPLCDARGRLAVGVELKDLALAAGERRPSDGRPAAGSTKRSDSAAASTAWFSASTGELLTT